ncbi:MAG: SDR family oxidoreductase [Pseudorhizobium sp.]
MNSTGKTLLLLGATSDIGRATAIAYGMAGWNVQLAGRTMEAVEREADDIRTRCGTSVTAHRLDILASEQFQPFIDSLPALPDTVVCVIGELGEQPRAEKETEHAVTVLRTNFEGPAILLGMLAERFAARGSGSIVGVSSVAGDRGRASNYVYGSAKAGFTAFLSGLRNRLASAGVRVLTIKPGFVRTRMTAGMSLPGLLTADPEEVGNAIFKASEASKNRDVIYVRSIWWPLMTVIRSIPEPVFKRLRL